MTLNNNNNNNAAKVNHDVIKPKEDLAIWFYVSHKTGPVNLVMV